MKTAWVDCYKNLSELNKFSNLPVICNPKYILDLWTNVSTISFEFVFFFFLGIEIVIVSHFC